MSTSIRPTVSTKNYDRVFETMKLPKKVGFEYALNGLLESIATSASKSHEVERNEDARK